MNPIVILAQAGPGFEDFVSQLPVGLFVVTCLVGILLIGSIIAIARARMNRGSNAQTPAPPAFVPAANPAKPRTASAALDELPDLDLLVESPPARQQPAAPQRNPRSGTFSVNVGEGESAQAVEVVTILRDVVDGGLIIQMGDRAYRDLDNDEAFRSKFLKIMRELGPMVTQTPAASASPTPATPPPAPKPAPASEDAAPSVRDLMDDMPDEEPDAAVPPAPKPRPRPQTTGGQLPGDLPKFTLEDKPQTIEKRGGLLGRKKTEFLPVPELDIPGAIEAFLQHKLVTTQAYPDRSIHVHPAEGGGVAIEVDGTFYDAVSDVEDAEVREYLSETIQEWQQRNAGG